MQKIATFCSPAVAILAGDFAGDNSRTGLVTNSWKKS
jgi:hypothetical protein